MIIKNKVLTVDLELFAFEEVSKSKSSIIIRTSIIEHRILSLNGYLFTEWKLWMMIFNKII